MLKINTRNDKLAAARVDFSSRGMLQGSCLGEALQLWRQTLGTDASDSDYNDDDEDDNNENDEFGGPDGNGEEGGDLDLDDNDDNDNDNDEDDGSPGPVDGPPVFSEVVLAQKKGIEPPAARTKNPR